MSRSKISWGTLAAIGAISFLGACTYMSPEGSNPPRPVASNPPPVPPGPNATWFAVGFTSGGYAIDADGRKVIQDVIAALQANPNAVATVIGRTDTVGGRDYNMRLSHRRADTVRDALVYRGGIPAARVETRWTGEGRQTVPAGNEAMVAANRVVDIAIH